MGPSQASNECHQSHNFNIFISHHHRVPYIDMHLELY